MATSIGFIGAPEQFDERTDDWVLYIQRFEHFLSANNVKEDAQKQHLLLAMIGGRTFKLLVSLVAPRKPKPIKIAKRFRFYKRNQLPAETVATYLAELRRLASTCEFSEFLNEALCDRLVCGLREEDMQRRLLVEPRLNLKRALELSQGIKAAQKDAKEIQSTENDLGATNRVGQSKNDTVFCSRCLGTGHAQAECKYRSAKCNKCYCTGHLAIACKSNGPRTSNAQAQSQGRRRQQHGKQPNQVHHVGSEDITKEQSPVDIIHVHSITPSVPESYKVPVEINGSHFIIELDTGAAVSIVSDLVRTFT